MDISIFDKIDKLRYEGKRNIIINEELGIKYNIVTDDLNYKYVSLSINEKNILFLELDTYVNFDKNILLSILKENINNLN